MTAAALPTEVPAPPEPRNPANANSTAGADSNTTQVFAIEKPAVKINPPPLMAQRPTQIGPLGIRFDFNLGARVSIPGGKPWRVRLRDLDTNNILFESSPGADFIGSAKRYYLRMSIEVLDERGTIFHHEYNAAKEHVLIQFPVGTLGDTIGWFPYAVKFQEQHRCKLTCVMSGLLIPLFKDAYPHIDFMTPEEIKVEKYYASYRIGLFFDDEDHVWQPCDFRLVGLHRTAGYILGVDPTEEAPRLGVKDDGPPVTEPYVCIAVQSTAQSKYWNNPHGWREVVHFLRGKGYRIICIDQKPTNGHGLVWNHIPNGAEDQTGDRPLAERVRWLRHAKAFVGLSSGLSWLAWASGAPVVMISGFTHPINEFNTPHRVINYHACNSCWNDVRLRFDHKDFLWCPRHANTPRQFECTRLITASQVIATLGKLV